MGRNSGEIQKVSIGDFELIFNAKDKRWSLRGFDPRSKIQNPYDPEMLDRAKDLDKCLQASDDAANFLKQDGPQVYTGDKEVLKGWPQT